MGAFVRVAWREIKLFGVNFNFLAYTLLEKIDGLLTTP